MGNIKKIATQEDLERLQGNLEETVQRIVRAEGTYNCTTIQRMIEDALEKNVAAGGNFNATTKNYVAEIHEAVVTKEEQG